MSSKDRLPEWAPADAGPEFAVRIRAATTAAGAMRAGGRRAGRHSVAELAEGVRERDPTRLARAITLVESNAPRHQEEARELVRLLAPHAGAALRIGITGIPGVGKSTFIEAFGNLLCDRGHRVAVLAVDPSSTLTRGSILGDKTRMEKLSRRPEAFIRPSPSGGSLGGVGRKSRETILLCEAAGFDRVLVETVGVGQAETLVRSMVDCFLLLLITGAGDELQGVKRGIMELADILAVTKADGANREAARRTCRETAAVLRYLQPATPGWKTTALTCSALTGEGVGEVADCIERFSEAVRASGQFERRRSEQNLDWLRRLVREALEERFFSRGAVASEWKTLETAVLSGELPVAEAALRLLEAGEAQSTSTTTRR
ncbi:MAG: methylmalonyl Co-A mutase-associated GTPase MeaB [Puniceicoccaceae bacterium]|nr:MAG: methylmalonyl Co-A mutase-associated GTPase MeaB [Puniceicoccaceae bacterium]